MEKLQDFINKSPNRKYYEHKFAKLTDDQKSELADLATRLDNAGAKNPLSWAFSEVTEGIPQFGRFLILKTLFTLARSTGDNIDIAYDFDEEIKEKYSEIAGYVGEDKLNSFLSSYSKGIIYNIIDLLDEGNLNYQEDKISWLLMKTDEEGEPTNQIIQGLHEDFLEFENELKQ